LIAAKKQNKKERINMTTKSKNRKVPKSVKTRLSDLAPEKDARAGKAGKNPQGTPVIYNPPPSAGASSTAKRHVTL
jgi:hypothetical protein